MYIYIRVCVFVACLNVAIISVVRMHDGSVWYRYHDGSWFAGTNVAFLDGGWVLLAKCDCGRRHGILESCMCASC